MKRPFILIDNYDSFTYNLITYLHSVAPRFLVFRNDEITLNQLENLQPAALLISPGPGRPQASGLTPQIISWAASQPCPLLGVCLGHQALGEHFGASLVSARRVMHGQGSWIHHDGQGIFDEIPNPLFVGRYHSLALEGHSIPPELVVTAKSDDGEVMGIRHRSLPLEGVQFHPESILTPEGKRLLANLVRFS